MMNQLKPRAPQHAAFLTLTELGYQAVGSGRHERLAPVNAELQIIFERTLWRFRQR